MSTERCPHCGATVKKENLKDHVKRVHSKQTGSSAQQISQARPVFRSHRKRNVIILALVLVAIVGISAAAAQFAALNTIRMHIHPQLTITSQSTGPVTIPAQIGIDASLWRDHSLDQYGTEGLSPLHTHDTTGTIHVESNVVRDFTLHQFLAVWGQPSDGSAIDGKTVIALKVDGQNMTTLTQDVVFKDQQKIDMTTS